MVVGHTARKDKEEISSEILRKLQQLKRTTVENSHTREEKAKAQKEHIGVDKWAKKPLYLTCGEV